MNQEEKIDKNHIKAGDGVSKEDLKKALVVTS